MFLRLFVAHETCFPANPECIITIIRECHSSKRLLQSFLQPSPLLPCPLRQPASAWTSNLTGLRLLIQWNLMSAEYNKRLYPQNDCDRRYVKINSVYKEINVHFFLDLLHPQHIVITTRLWFIGSLAVQSWNVCCMSLSSSVICGQSSP